MTMYAREWRCRVPLNERDGFIAYLYETGIRETTATPGYQGAQIFLREIQGMAEITLITYWDDMSSIEAFAGEDIDKARLYPDDQKYHLEPDLTVNHYAVLEHSFIPGLTFKRPHNPCIRTDPAEPRG
jgi:heme-degrading monooxygenase HmoA